MVHESNHVTLSSLVLSLLRHRNDTNDRAAFDGGGSDQLLIPARFRGLAKMLLPKLNHYEASWELYEEKTESLKAGILRIVMYQLMQLLPPEAAFSARDRIPAKYVHHYLSQQHFNLEAFIAQSLRLLDEIVTVIEPSSPLDDHGRSSKGKQKQAEEDQSSDPDLRRVWVFAPAPTKYVVYTRSNAHTVKLGPLANDKLTQVISLSEFQNPEMFRNNVMQFSLAPTKRALIIACDTHLVSPKRINHIR